MPTTRKRVSHGLGEVTFERRRRHQSCSSIKKPIGINRFKRAVQADLERMLTNERRGALGDDCRIA